MSLNEYLLFNTKKHDKNQLSYYLIDEIANRLISKLDFVNLACQRILLDGFWSYASIKFLEKRYPNSQIFYQMPRGFSLSPTIESVQVVNGAEKDASYQFDLVLSNLYLHHFQSAESHLQHLKRHLSDHGGLFFVSIGPNTLFPATSRVQRPSNWMDMHDVGDVLRKIYFKDPVMDAEIINIHHKSYQQFSCDISFICVLLAIDSLDDEFKKDLYAKLQANNPMPIEIVYGHAWQQKLEQRHLENEVYVSLKTLKRHKE
ncbi:hypothetical protein L3V82_03100 [Thiotrichales bacterium 19S3-7]|nr:hypothetical protein [Thiotrichales bacterium 19S3-7]MCF6801157.1 hypothetical protein [Thiotrichales bacterium 19S3-11]